MYNIVIHTRIYKDSIEQLEISDTLILNNVHEDVREFIEDSCSITFGKLIRNPAVEIGAGYILWYKTLITDLTTGKTTGDRWIKFPAMSKDNIVQFQLWAAQELAETIRVKSLSEERIESRAGRSGVFRTIKNIFAIIFP